MKGHARRPAPDGLRHITRVQAWLLRMFGPGDSWDNPLVGAVRLDRAAARRDQASSRPAGPARAASPHARRGPLGQHGSSASCRPPTTSDATRSRRPVWAADRLQRRVSADRRTCKLGNGSGTLTGGRRRAARDCRLRATTHLCVGVGRAGRLPPRSKPRRAGTASPHPVSGLARLDHYSAPQGPRQPPTRHLTRS